MPRRDLFEPHNHWNSDVRKSTQQRTLELHKRLGELTRVLAADGVEVPHPENFRGTPLPLLEKEVKKRSAQKTALTLGVPFKPEEGEATIKSRIY
jgi:hypothetical protein